MKVKAVEIYATVARWFHPQDLRSSWSRHLHTAPRFTLDLVRRWLRKPWWRCWAADLVMEVFNMEMLPIRVLMYLDNVTISSYIYILCTILILLVNYYVYMIIWLCIVYTYIKLSGTMCHCTISTVCNAHSAFLNSEPRSPACPNLNLLGALERRSTEKESQGHHGAPLPPLPSTIFMFFRAVVPSRMCTQCNKLSTPQHALGLGSGTTTECIPLVCKTQLQIKFQFCSWVLCDMIILLISFCSTIPYICISCGSLVYFSCRSRGQNQRRKAIRFWCNPLTKS